MKIGGASVSNFSIIGSIMVRASGPTAGGAGALSLSLRPTVIRGVPAWGVFITGFVW